MDMKHLVVQFATEPKPAETPGMWPAVCEHDSLAGDPTGPYTPQALTTIRWTQNEKSTNKDCDDVYLCRESMNARAVVCYVAVDPLSVKTVEKPSRERANSMTTKCSKQCPKYPHDINKRAAKGEMYILTTPQPSSQPCSRCDPHATMCNLGR